MLESNGLFFDGDMWKDPRIVPNNYNPNQKQIEFFWPLTEQIYLDLDFSGCDTRSKATTSASAFDITSNSVLSMVDSNMSWSTSINTDTIETKEITFTLNKKPFIIKRMMYNLLGIKWKIK